MQDESKASLISLGNKLSPEEIQLIKDYRAGRNNKVAEVKRVYPEAITGLINWMEQNFHDIDSFVITFKLKDKEIWTAHHTESYYEALAISMWGLDTIQKLGEDFVPSKAGDAR